MALNICFLGKIFIVLQESHHFINLFESCTILTTFTTLLFIIRCRVCWSLDFFSFFLRIDKKLPKLNVIGDYRYFFIAIRLALRSRWDIPNHTDLLMNVVIILWHFLLILMIIIDFLFFLFIMLLIEMFLNPLGDGYMQLMFIIIFVYSLMLRSCVLFRYHDWWLWLKILWMIKVLCNARWGAGCFFVDDVFFIVNILFMLLIVKIVMLGISLVMVCSACGETVGVVDKVHIVNLLSMMIVILPIFLLITIPC